MVGRSVGSALEIAQPWLRVGLALLVMSACTYQRKLSDAYDLSGAVTVESHKGEVVKAVVVNTDAGLVLLAANGDPLARDEVAKVTEVRRVRGALEGLGIGFGVGAVLGAGIGFADGDDECSSEGWCILIFSAEEKAMLGGFAFGVIGGGLGLLIGAMTGSRFIYENGERPPMIRPVGPPGSVAGMTVTW
jgi:hypothetical protein